MSENLPIKTGRELINKNMCHLLSRTNKQIFGKEIYFQEEKKCLQWWGWGAESLCEKLRDQMGKGVRGQIIMDFVFLLKSLRFIVSSAENS